MSTELRTLVLNYLLADVQLRQLSADDAFASALASVAADLRHLLAAKSSESPIDWSQAPEWAQWLAMDAEGEWYWYESEPLRVARKWFPDGGRAAPVFQLRWRESLQQRPE